MLERLGKEMEGFGSHFLNGVNFLEYMQPGSLNGKFVSGSRIAACCFFATAVVAKTARWMSPEETDTRASRKQQLADIGVTSVAFFISVASAIKGGLPPSITLALTSIWVSTEFGNFYNYLEQLPSSRRRGP